jgi:hypothetical protein
MRLFNDVVGHLHTYYTDRNVENLNAAIKLLAGEAQEPQLQEAIITIPMTPEELVAMVKNNEGFLKFKMSELDADKPVESKKLIRVKAKDELFDIMCVAHLDTDLEGDIILVPAGGVE